MCAFFFFFHTTRGTRILLFFGLFFFSPLSFVGCRFTSFLSLSLSLARARATRRESSFLSRSLSSLLTTARRATSLSPPIDRRYTQRERDTTARRMKFAGERERKERVGSGRCVKEKLQKSEERELRSGTFFFGRKSARKARKLPKNRT